MRLFVGIPIEEPARSFLRESIVGLKPLMHSCRWTRPQNLHLTLRFLGEVAESELPSVQAWFREHTSGMLPSELHLDKPGWFVNRGEFFMWVGVQPCEALTALADSLSGPVASVPSERRAFVTHVTVGRWRSGRRDSQSKEEFLKAFGELRLAEVTLQKPRVVLYRSILGGGTGPEYREILSAGA